MPELQNPLLFEHPLNERTRTLLRISHLFEQFEYHLPASSHWQSRAAVQALLDIVSILGRADIKQELIKQLEQQKQSLERIADNPGVDQIRLRQVLEDISRMSERLFNTTSQLGNSLRKNEFLNSIAQRAPIPGGSFEFDLPQFHYWLNLPHTERVMQLDDWRHEISLVQETTDLLLGILRNSNVFRSRNASEGFFQQSLDRNRQVDLIQVMLPAESFLYAEISGNKHRFCIRFMESTQWEQPEQTGQEVTFKLKTCAI
ncbi:cell division protein ZapD [Thiolapillus sp.]